MLTCFLSLAFFYKENSVYYTWKWNRSTIKEPIRKEKDAKERYKTSEIIREYSIYSRRNAGTGDRGTGSALSGKIYGRGRTSYRQQAKVKHSMKDVVGIVFFAVLAGNDEWSEIYDFALDEREVLEKYLV